jgi:hypothetical protein
MLIEIFNDKLLEIKNLIRSENIYNNMKEEIKCFATLFEHKDIINTEDILFKYSINDFNNIIQFENINNDIDLNEEFTISIPDVYIKKMDDDNIKYEIINENKFYNGMYKIIFNKIKPYLKDPLFDNDLVNIKDNINSFIYRNLLNLNIISETNHSIKNIKENQSKVEELNLATLGDTH